MYKRYVWNGGICDPLIISWPAKIEADGKWRHQYGHAIDMVPTVLDLLGIEISPARLKCALLSLDTLQRALEGRESGSASNTTQGTAP